MPRTSFVLLSVLTICETATGLRVTPLASAQPAHVRRSARAALATMEEKPRFSNPFAQKPASESTPAEGTKEEEEGWTLDKVAALGLAGVLSIAVAESVFWLLSFPVSAVVYYVATGEWINLLEQEGQVKFLAFTAGWGALGGAIAQYRTVLTAAALTPWMDRTVVKPYLAPMIDSFKKEES